MPKGYRKIPGINSKIMISPSGKVVRQTRAGWKPVEHFPQNGYPSVHVGRNDYTKAVTMPVHRLVALAYLYDKNDAKPFTEYHVHHLDANKKNCSKANLKLVTPKEHAKYHSIYAKYISQVFNTKKFQTFLQNSLTAAAC